MLSTNDRRLAIRDAISDRRHTTIEELARDFGVSKATIKRDLVALTGIISYYGTTGPDGGIHATEGWYSSRRYLSSDQEAFLKKLKAGLQTEADQRMMEGILCAFAMPQHNES